VQRAALCVCRTLVRAGRTDLRMTTRKLGYPTKYLRVPPGTREARQPRPHDRFDLPPPWRRVIASATFHRLRITRRDPPKDGLDGDAVKPNLHTQMRDLASLVAGPAFGDQEDCASWVRTALRCAAWRADGRLAAETRIHHRAGLWLRGSGGRGAPRWPRKGRPSTSGDEMLVGAAKEVSGGRSVNPALPHRHGGSAAVAWPGGASASHPRRSSRARRLRCSPQAVGGADRICRRRVKLVHLRRVKTGPLEEASGGLQSLESLSQTGP
jgi:hypothetical protein